MKRVAIGLVACTLIVGAAPRGFAAGAAIAPAGFHDARVRVVLGEGRVPVVTRSEGAAAAMLGLEAEPDPATRVAPGLAFLMSAVLPGTGQLVEGRNRAFAYLGVEAVSWIAHFSYQDASHKKTTESHQYADKHWSLDQWQTLASGAVDSCRDAFPVGRNYADAKSTIENELSQPGRSRYYSSIDASDDYRAGWDDYSCASPAAISPERQIYRAMRDRSDTYLSRARQALTISFLNRVVSAVDAYRTARGARVNIASGTDLHLDLAGSLDRPRATLRVTRRW